jgi:hypothetical protein
MEVWKRRRGNVWPKESLGFWEKKGLKQESKQEILI